MYIATSTTLVKIFTAAIYALSSKRTRRLYAHPCSTERCELVTACDKGDACGDKSSQNLHVYHSRTIISDDRSSTYALLALSSDLLFGAQRKSRSVSVWDFVSGKIVSVVSHSGLPDFIASLAFVEKTRELLVGRDNGTLDVWDLQNAREPALTEMPFAAHKGPCAPQRR